MSENRVFRPLWTIFGHFSDNFSTFFGHFVDLPFFWAVQRFASYNSEPLKSLQSTPFLNNPRSSTPIEQGTKSARGEIFTYKSMLSAPRSSKALQCPPATVAV